MARGALASMRQRMIALLISHTPKAQPFLNADAGGSTEAAQASASAELPRTEALEVSTAICAAEEFEAGRPERLPMFGWRRMRRAKGGSRQCRREEAVKSRGGGAEGLVGGVGGNGEEGFGIDDAE